MEVIAQGLVPGVQHTDEPEPAVEVSAAKLEQGLRDSFEQDIAEHLLVHQYEWVEFVRESEYEMEVAYGEQVGFAVFEPLGLGQRATLGTVAVAAGVVSRLPIAAGVTLLEVPTECGGAAG